jgi:hypothetical protein
MGRDCATLAGAPVAARTTTTTSIVEEPGAQTKLPAPEHARGQPYHYGQGVTAMQLGSHNAQRYARGLDESHNQRACAYALPRTHPPDRFTPATACTAVHGRASWQGGDCCREALLQPAQLQHAARCRRPTGWRRNKTKDTLSTHTCIHNAPGPDRLRPSPHRALSRAVNTRAEAPCRGSPLPAVDEMPPASNLSQPPNTPATPIYACPTGRTGCCLGPRPT